MLNQLEEAGRARGWSFALRRQYWIVQEIYRQQVLMHRDRRRRIDERIVSVGQPHVRPVKRGKGSVKNTEFGPKINASMTEGFTRADQIDFNAFNEANHLITQLEGYRARFGYYPGRVLADKIYWTRQNRKWLKARNIHMGGVPLGPKPKQSKYQKGRERKRNNERSEVEGKFGEAKERYGLARLHTRLPQTTKAEVSLILLAMNLVKLAATVVLTYFIAYMALQERQLRSIWKHILDWPHHRATGMLAELGNPQRWRLESLYFLGSPMIVEVLHDAAAMIVRGEFSTSIYSFRQYYV